MNGRATIESRPTRTFRTFSCSHQGCREGRAASLLIDSSPSEELESELDARQEQLQRGLSPRRLAGAIRSRHGTGDYLIHKVRPQIYEIRGIDDWNAEDATTLADEIASVAPHVKTEIDALSRVVTVRDARFSANGGQVARPDGGYTTEQAHRHFQEQGPLGGQNTGDYWTERRF